jgi:hypothetical protein
VEGTGAQAINPAMPVTMAPSPTRKSPVKSSLKKQVPWTGEIWRKHAN